MGAVIAAGAVLMLVPALYEVDDKVVAHVYRVGRAVGGNGR